MWNASTLKSRTYGETIFYAFSKTGALQGGNSQAAESLQVSQPRSSRDNTLPALDGKDNQPLKPADGAITFAESSVPSTTRIENGGDACYWMQDVFREVFFVREAQRKS